MNAYLVFCSVKRLVLAVPKGKVHKYGVGD